MSTAIERYEPRATSIELAPQAWKLAKAIAHTEFVPKALRGKEEAVLACILTGHEIGISPMQALAKIHVIEGRPALSAEMMRAIVEQAGHEIWVEEATQTRVVVAAKRANTDRVLRVSWTIDDAKRAGLAGKDNWRKYPRAMLFARATAEICRMVFADVLAGLSYAVEELQDGIEVDDAVGLSGFEPEETAAAPAAPRPTARAARAATRGRAPAPVDDPAPAPERARGEVPLLPGEDESDIVDADVVEDGDLIRDTLNEIVDEIADRFAGEDIAPHVDAVADVAAQVAEITDTPPLPDEDWHDPAPDTNVPRYSAAQVIAMKLGEHGIRVQADRRRWVSEFVGHPVETTKDLSHEEAQQAIDYLNQLDEGELIYLAPVEPTPPPAPRAAVTPPEEWTGDRWREFLKARSVKATEVIRAAIAIGAAADPPVVVGSLDDLAGSGIASDVVGWIEDRT